jgi:hypothetical protein
VLFLPLALGLAAASIVLALRAGSGPPCAGVTQLAAAGGRQQQQSKICKSEPQLGFYGK